MDKELLTAIEKRLLNEVAKIEAQITNLKNEKTALEKQIAKARAERTGLQSVTRKNSLNRVVAENSVLEALRTLKRPCSTRQLYLNALETNSGLKETTFRTYLHRMKNKSLIETAGHVGQWQIAKTKEAPS